MSLLEKLIEQFTLLNRRTRRWKRTVSVISAILVFVTTYAMILPAITLDKNTAQEQPGIEIAAGEANMEESGAAAAGTEPEEETAGEDAAGPEEDGEADPEDNGGEAEPEESEKAEPEESGEAEPESGEDAGLGDHGAEDNEDASSGGDAVGDGAADADNGDGADVEDDGISDAETGDVTDEAAATGDTEIIAEDNFPVEIHSADDLAAAIAEGRIELITEKTQLVYEYIDEEYEKNKDRKAGDNSDEEEDADDGYLVYAEVDADAKLPAGVELQVREITQENDPDEYAEYYEKILDELQDEYDENTGLYFARFYDISFVYQGFEVEPGGDVKVRIEYNREIEVGQDVKVDAVHFDKENDGKPEIIESRVNPDDKEKAGKKLLKKSRKIDEAENEPMKAVEFTSDRFSVYGIIGSGSITVTYLTADGKTYFITVNFDEDAEIPAGTKLVVNEVEKETDEYQQYFGRTWMEVNKEYLEQKEEKNNDPDGQGEYKDIPRMNIDQARFFDITLMKDGRVIEPKTPAHVEIRFAEGLGVEGIDERIAGISHFKGDKPDLVNNTKTSKGDAAERIDDTEVFTGGAVELINNIVTAKDEEGRIVEYRYEQDSFSGIGTYIGHESTDGDGTPYVPKLRLLRGEGPLGEPRREKHLDANLKDDNSEDGTYTLSLSVTGDSRESTKTETQKSNVLFIMDRSSSMVTNKDAYLRYTGDSYPSTTSFYGRLNNGNYVDITYNPQNGKWTYTRPTPPFGEIEYDPNNGIFLLVTRLDAEQAALNDLFDQLLAKNAGGEENRDNIEISVISFATFAGKDQTSTYYSGVPWGDTEITWQSGTDKTALMNGVNDDASVARGTNWEEALKYAKEVMDDKKAAEIGAGHTDEDYYVIFLTDGGPTATSYSITTAEGSGDYGAYYGTSGHYSWQLDDQVVRGILANRPMKMPATTLKHWSTCMKMGAADISCITSSPMVRIMTISIWSA